MKQEDFNRIIDLLADTMTAKAQVESLPEKYKTDANKVLKLAYQNYINTVKELYRPNQVPEVYQKAYDYQNIHISPHSFASVNPVVKYIWLSFDIEQIQKQLNNDFVLHQFEEGLEVVRTPLTYTGNYRHVNTKGSYVVSYQNNSNTIYSFYSSSHLFKLDFHIRLLAHPATLLFGASLLIAGLRRMQHDPSPLDPGVLIGFSGLYCMYSHLVAKLGFLSPTVTAINKDTPADRHEFVLYP